MRRYVIVGNGVTGTRAAEVLRQKQPDAVITLLSDEAYPFYKRPQLADYASGQIAEARMWGKPADFYARLGLDLRLSSPVAAVDPGAHSVRLESGEELVYDALLVASGRKAAPGAVRGAKAAGLNSFKSMAEARAVRELAGEGRTGLVAGNGLLALEMVRALSAAGFKTTYVVPTERLWPEVLDAAAAEIAESRVRAAAVELVLGAPVKAVETEAGRASGLVLADGRTLWADVVGYSDSYVPAVEFLPDGGRGFSVDASLATPWPDVYGAGDVGVASNTLYFNWLRSWREGALAGARMAGEAIAALPAVDILNMQVLGLSLVAMGKTTYAYRSGYSEMRGDLPFGEVYKRLVFSPEGVLVGALLVGNIAEAGALEQAIRRGLTKDELDPGLLKQMFEVTYKASYLGVQCPVCRHEIQLETGAAEGDLVTCPICGTDFTLARGEVGLVARVARD